MSPITHYLYEVFRVQQTLMVASHAFQTINHPERLTDWPSQTGMTSVADRTVNRPFCRSIWNGNRTVIPAVFCFSGLLFLSQSRIIPMLSYVSIISTVDSVPRNDNIFAGCSQSLLLWREYELCYYRIYFRRFVWCFKWGLVSVRDYILLNMFYYLSRSIISLFMHTYY